MIARVTYLQVGAEGVRVHGQGHDCNSWDGLIVEFCCLNSEQLTPKCQRPRNRVSRCAPRGHRPLIIVGGVGGRVGGSGSGDGGSGG